MTVKFRIQRTGNVRGVRVEAPAILQKGGIYGCIKGVVGGIRFPPSNGSQVVSLPVLADLNAARRGARERDDRRCAASSARQVGLADRDQRGGLAGVSRSWRAAARTSAGTRVVVGVVASATTWSM